MAYNTDKQVVIPPELPDILKTFTKAAIRTQPEDLLEWSLLYFSALVSGQALPVKETSEREVTPSFMDLTPEVLSAMHAQVFKQDLVISAKEAVKVWRSFGLADDLLRHIWTVGEFGNEIDWMKFFAMGCSYLGGTIKNSMIHALYILNSDSTCQPPDACVPFETFHFLYSYLAEVDGEVSQSQIDRALTYLETQAKVNNGMVKVSHFLNGHKVRLG